MKTLSDLDLSGKRALVRVDFNVPMDGGTITDDTRIQAALPTIRALLDAGATPVLMSHLGRPKGEPDPAFSLRPVATYLDSLLDAPVVFCQETVGDAAKACVDGAPDGAVVLLPAFVCTVGDVAESTRPWRKAWSFTPSPARSSASARG